MVNNVSLTERPFKTVLNGAVLATWRSKSVIHNWVLAKWLFKSVTNSCQKARTSVRSLVGVHEELGFRRRSSETGGSCPGNLDASNVIGESTRSLVSAGTLQKQGAALALALTLALALALAPSYKWSESLRMIHIPRNRA